MQASSIRTLNNEEIDIANTNASRNNIDDLNNDIMRRDSDIPLEYL